MHYTEIIAVYSQIHTKHINTLCGQNVELLQVTPACTYTHNHCALRSNKELTAMKLLVNKPVSIILARISNCHSSRPVSDLPNKDGGNSGSINNCAIYLIVWHCVK